MKSVKHYTTGCLCFESKQIDSRKENGMNLKKKVVKKITTLILSAAMAVGGSLSVFAATGFTVSEPSLAYWNGGYIASGGMSYYSSTSSETYYLRDIVTARVTQNGYNVEYRGVGYGYNAASAMTSDTITVRPYYIENQGSYKSSTSFTVVGTKYKNNP